MLGIEETISASLCLRTE
uniref:Uncharacterized protein n=1 Tax=Arundo donax TaxID=35708 RepID=A0A0A9ACD8_ARUDO